MAQVMRIRWDPNTGNPETYYEEESSPPQYRFGDLMGEFTQEGRDRLGQGIKSLSNLPPISGGGIRSGERSQRDTALASGMSDVLGGAASTAYNAAITAIPEILPDWVIGKPWQRKQLANDIGAMPEAFAGFGSAISGPSYTRAANMTRDSLLGPDAAALSAARANSSDFMRVGRLPSEDGLTLWQGSPANFSAELKVRMPDGTEKFIVGTPTKYPSVPPGATVIEEYPYGRLRREFNLTGEGQAAFGPGHYLAQRKGIGENYRDALTDRKILVNGREENAGWDDITTSRLLDRKEEELFRKNVADLIPGASPEKHPYENLARVPFGSLDADEIMKIAREKTNKEFSELLSGGGVKINTSLSDVWDPFSKLPTAIGKAIRDNAKNDQSAANHLGYSSVGEMNRAAIMRKIRAAVEKSYSSAKKLRGVNVTKSAGNLYEHVLPNRIIDDFVDQNLPFSRQPQIVKDAFVERFGKEIPDNFDMKEILRGRNPFSPYKVSLEKTPQENEAKNLADFLFSKGIPGSKFYDAASRSDGVDEATRNYVLFGDDLTKIVNKYMSGGIVSLT